MGQEEYAAFTVTVTRGDPNYADLIVVLSIGVGPAFAVPARLELSEQTQPGETTYTNNNIANFSEGAYSRLSGGNFTKNEPGDTTKLEVDKDTGIISGNDLGLGTHTITVEVTSNNFIGTAQAELILTVESPPPNPDNVVANRQISQPIAVGHSGDPGYVIPIAANYTLANPQYDETQITIANGNEIRLATPMPNSNLVAALTADAQCITQTGDCGALKITITATFTPVSTGTFLNLILPNRTDPFGTHRVPRPAGYPNAAVAITLTSHLGILRHDGTQVETLAPAFAFFALDSNDDLIQGPDGFPDAGTHGIGFSVTDPGYLGAVAVVGAVTSPANNLGPEFALAQTEATVTVAPGFSGMVYQTTLQTENGVIGSPYIVAPDSGFSAGLLGDTTLAVVIEDIVGPGAADILATVRATIGNAADPANFQPVGAQLELRIVALPDIPAAEYIFVQENYDNAALHDFRTAAPVNSPLRPFENATFTEVGNSPELTVTPEGVVGTDGQINSTGTYAITVEATDANAYVGSARLTLTLRLVGTDANATPDELLAAFAPVLNVAQDETGEIHRLEPLNGYTFGYDPQEANPELVLDSGTGAISIPAGETMGADERRVTIGAEVNCPASGDNPRGIPCLTGALAQQVEIVVVANGVANPAANFAVFYNDPRRPCRGCSPPRRIRDRPAAGSCPSHRANRLRIFPGRRNPDAGRGKLSRRAKLFIPR